MVELRWLKSSAPVPQTECQRLGREPVCLTAVHAIVPSASLRVELLEWLLLTTLPAGNANEARRVLGHDALRWRIEEYQEILKSGRDVEKFTNNRAARRQRVVTVDAVIAWPLSVLKLAGRYWLLTLCWCIRNCNEACKKIIKNKTIRSNQFTVRADWLQKQQFFETMVGRFDESLTEKDFGTDMPQGDIVKGDANVQEAHRVVGSARTLPRCKAQSLIIGLGGGVQVLVCLCPALRDGTA